MEKFIEALKNIRTTIMGLLLAIPSMLLAFGVIDVTKKEGLEQAIPAAIDGIIQALEVIVGLMGTIGGIGLLFSKDGHK